MKLPSVAAIKSKLAPVKKKADGKTYIYGMTPRDWGLNCAAIWVLYIIFIVFFTALLLIAQAVRRSKDTFIRPGSEHFLDQE